MMLFLCEHSPNWQVFCTQIIRFYHIDEKEFTKSNINHYNSVWRIFGHWLACTCTTDVERRWFLFFLPILFKTHVISFSGHYWSLGLSQELNGNDLSIVLSERNDHPRQASTDVWCNGLLCFLPWSRLLFETLLPPSW